MFFELVFSKYMCGFRKVNAQQCLLVMIEKLKSKKTCLDRNGVSGAN